MDMGRSWGVNTNKNKWLMTNGTYIENKKPPWGRLQFSLEDLPTHF